MTKEIGDSDLLDTWAATGAISEPTIDKKNVGWELQEQPPHEYANWLANILGKAVNHIMRNGVPRHSTTTNYLIGDIVKVSGVLYKAKADNVGSVPPNVNWQQLAPYPVKKSIAIDDGALQLTGDSNAPGNSKYYGTNASGEKGFHTVVINGLDTGDLKFRYGSGEIAGYVRLNNRTIGNALSAATERANADTEDLFTHLWNEDVNIEVSGGRGASAAADFAANKRITLPDARNRSLIPSDGMGGSNSGRITGGTELGISGGKEDHTLAINELPEHYHIQGDPVETGHSANYLNGNTLIGNTTSNLQTVTGGYPASNEHVNTSNVGDGDAHNNMQPFIVIGTVYIKL